LHQRAEPGTRDWKKGPQRSRFCQCQTSAYELKKKALGPLHSRPKKGQNPPLRRILQTTGYGTQGACKDGSAGGTDSDLATTVPGTVGDRSEQAGNQASRTRMHAPRKGKRARRSNIKCLATEWGHPRGEEEKKKVADSQSEKVSLHTKEKQGGGEEKRGEDGEQSCGLPWGSRPRRDSDGAEAFSSWTFTSFEQKGAHHSAPNRIKRLSSSI